MRTSTNSSRRTFLKAAASSVAMSAAESPVLGRKLEGREKLQEFDYADVRLTGGPLKDQYDRILKSFLTLDNDRLLKVYRQRAGLPAPGEDMGGWYDANGFVPGHTIGQYISGFARYWRATGNTAARDKARDLVNGFAASLGPDGYPFASPKAATTWPCYILDKYEIALIDAYRLIGMNEAKELLPRVIHGAMPNIPDHTYDRGPNSPKQAPYDEPYILSENLFNTYEVTGNREFLDLAVKYLLNAEYFDPLADGKNVLPGKHAYSHVIALSSAAKAYLVLGDPKYLNAIRNAWDMIETTQQFSSGGWGPKEAFVVPHEGKLAASLASTRDHFESPCGCYAHVKLARYLLRTVGESRYGDGLERVLYNTLLPAKDPDGEGRFFYYSDYHAEAKKGYYHSKWPCCSGTLIQGVADYPINIYFHSPDHLFVNLFVPSEVRWSVRGTPVKLIQSTRYPEDGLVHLRVECDRPTNFTCGIRVPGWLKEPPKMLVSGKPYKGNAQPGSFAPISRKWKSGDSVEVSFPLPVRTEFIDDRNPNTVAVMRGPLLMVAIDPSSDLAGTPLRLPSQLQQSKASPMDLEYDLSGKILRFRPFFAVQDEIYNTYFQQSET
jgi:DUF1680 family protein